MGLREDAEAARLASMDAAAEKKRQEACAREQREQARRREEFETAWEIGEQLGIPWAYLDGEPEHIWVTDSAPEGYTPRVWLHMRSEDGVWLRYQCYRPGMYRADLHRWMVVVRCPQGDHWIIPTGWATQLAGIGEQLARQESWVARHIRAEHPED